MKAPLLITDHAVERFIERHIPGEDYVRAVQRLNAIRCQAEHVEDIPGEPGQEIWRGREAGSLVDILMVVKNHLVTTVLPIGATRPNRRPVRP